MFRQLSVNLVIQVVCILTLTACGGSQSQPATAMPTNTPLPAATLTAAEKEALGPALIEAAEADDTTEASRLIELGVDVNTKNEMDLTPLMIAARNGNMDLVRLLVDSNADINLEDQALGYSAFIWAGPGGHTDVAQLLLEAGADINAQYRGRTALHLAAASGQLEFTQFLIDSGADLNVTSEILGDRTPLMSAVEGGKVEVAKLLIDAGVDVSIQDERGETALVYAVAYTLPQPEIIRLLLDAGADVNSQRQGGMTVLDSALTPQSGEVADIYREVADILRQAGGLTQEELEAKNQ